MLRASVKNSKVLYGEVDNRQLEKLLEIIYQTVFQLFFIKLERTHNFLWKISVSVGEVILAYLFLSLN